MLTIYHNPRCSKSRQTLKLLEETGKPFETIEYLKDVPTSKELKEVLKKLKLSPEQLIRKGESEFKENFKGKQLTDEEWINAMVAYPKLIERPIVIHGNNAILGRPPENINKLF